MKEYKKIFNKFFFNRIFKKKFKKIPYKMASLNRIKNILWERNKSLEKI